jgi:hypothetical protein
MTWTCPQCDRRAAEAVLAIARGRGGEGLVIEAVTVGIFVKRERTIVELRPKQKWLQLSVVSAAVIASRRITRAIPLAGGTAYFLRLRDERDVDAELRGWLRAALSSAAS